MQDVDTLPGQPDGDQNPEMCERDQDVDVDGSQCPDPNVAPPSQNKTQGQAFYNLAVSQKAVIQPTLKLRTWTTRRKNETPEGRMESMTEIESRLPPLRGPDTNIAEYKAIPVANHE
jgi:hypothetical protein